MFSSLLRIVLDALFPLAPAEKELISLSPREAFTKLPRAHRFPIREACSYFAYKDERVRKLIWSLKYKKSRISAAIGGYALYVNLMKFRLVAHVIVIPMPITKQRRRMRGYNQCDLLADEIERLDVCKNLAIIRNLLVRTRHTSKQTFKDREHRLQSMHDIFGVTSFTVEKVKNLIQKIAASKENYIILIIDDVVTTGSTIKDAINTLKASGFENVFGLSVAH